MAAPLPSTFAASKWSRFATSFLVSAAALVLLLSSFVLVVDPYGTRAGPTRPPTPIMDLNQRFMYPQIVRSRRYDSAVFGTSTIRLLDPERLNALFGGRFANLGLNAGTPWEQVQLMELFLRHVPAPKTLIFGLDPTWCEPDADVKRLTFRAFPPWLYDDRRLNDFAPLLSLKSLEIAGRVALHWLGHMPARIRADGYEVFVPPEAAYDLARARLHIWGGAERRMTTVEPPVGLSDAERAALRMPALPWLEAVLGRLPESTVKILTFMPVHVAAQAAPGSRAFAEDEECKQRIARIAERHTATVVDFRRTSPVTTEDANYWDPLHYRIGIAERIAAALHDAVKAGEDAPDGFYRVLARRR